MFSFLQPQTLFGGHGLPRLVSGFIVYLKLAFGTEFPPTVCLCRSRLRWLRTRFALVGNHVVFEIEESKQLGVHHREVLSSYLLYGGVPLRNLSARRTARRNSPELDPLNVVDLLTCTGALHVDVFDMFPGFLHMVFPHRAALRVPEYPVPSLVNVVCQAF